MNSINLPSTASIFKTFFEKSFQKKNIAIVLSGAFLLFAYKAYHSRARRIAAKKLAEASVLLNDNAIKRYKEEKAASPFPKKNSNFPLSIAQDFKKAADMGLIQAKYNYVTCLLEGIGIEKNEAAVDEFLKNETSLSKLIDMEILPPVILKKVLYDLAQTFDREKEFGEYQHCMAQAAIRGHGKAKTEHIHFQKWTEDERNQVFAFRATLPGESEASGKSEE